MYDYSHFPRGLVIVTVAVLEMAVALLPLSDLRCIKSINLTGPCLPLNNSICMGGDLSFKLTSLNLASDSDTLSDVYSKLQLWSGLKNVPQCWAVVQPFICSVYLPRCDDAVGVELPSKELCQRVRKPCRIVEQVKGWPDFLQCDDPNFVSGCKTETYDKLIFNTSGKCEHPLVRTDNPDSWFEGVEGCGIPCNSPLFSDEQHQEVHIFIAVFGSICLLCTLFTVLTFIIDWKNANRYPALILFFINTCFLLGSVGWMAQFAGDARKDIVCRRDGTVRKAEPKLGSNESISCTMVFVIVYYFLVAGMSWFVMLAYAWYLTFVALGTPRDGLTSKTAYFHLVSWCSPLVLTIICLAISEVDGDSVSGICFVGGINHSVRAVFVLVPVGLVVVVGTFFLLRGVYTLIQIRKEAPVFIPEKTFSKIRDTIIRLGIFTTVALVFVLITFAVHVYVFAYEDSWKQSFREYMYCVANVSVTAQSNGAHCQLEERPSLVAMEIHIFAFFGAGIAMSSWSWTQSSLAAWERFFRWIFHKPSNKPVRLKRHRMIAQAFEKRKEINQGRVSISYRSSHDDPLGMKFDLNSCSDDDLSSTFAMAMPKLVRRRGGLIYPSPGIGRRYSDSDVQSVISTRRVSRESQFLEFREAQFVVFDRDQLPYDPYGKKSRKKLKKKRGKLNRIKPVMGPMFSGRNGNGNMMMMMTHHNHRRRKESDSSAISQMSAQSVRRMPMKHHNSVETVSLESNNNNNDKGDGRDTILPAVTKSSHSNSVVADQDSSYRMRQFLKDLKGSNKERVGGGLTGGVGGATKGMQEMISLPGVVVDETEDYDDEEEEKVEEIIDEKIYPHDGSNQLKQSTNPKNNTSNNAKQRGRRQSVAVGMPGIPTGSNNNKNKKNHQSSPVVMPHRCVKTTSSSATTTVQKKKKTMKTLTTMEGMDLSCIPFSPLMADIGGGNWGVLLGKSGSSSGSEAGGYLSGGSFYKPISHNLTPHLFHHQQQQRRRQQQQQQQQFSAARESAFRPVHSHHPQPSNRISHVNPDYAGYDTGHNYHNNYLGIHGGGSPYDVYGGGGYASSCMGGAMPHMGGALPHMGEALSHMGGTMPYMGGMGGAKPSSGINEDNHLHHNQNHRQQIARGGARPKVRENLGHFPAHVFYNGNGSNSNNHHRRHLQEKDRTQTHRLQGSNKNRTMKVPDHTFFNSTFEVDDDIESISA